MRQTALQQYQEWQKRDGELDTATRNELATLKKKLVYTRAEQVLAERRVPDKDTLIKNLTNGLDKLEITQIIKIAKKLEVSSEKLESVLKALEQHRKTKPPYPGDDGDPSSGRKTTQQSKARPARKKEHESDRKNGKGRGGR